MRHRKDSTKLGRSSSHLKATIASLVCNLIERKRIRTTVVKAKTARRLADKMVTLAKSGTLADRRLAIARLRREDVVAQLWELVATFSERQGGYTRVVKLGRRRGDGSEEAMLEWVDIAPAAATRTKKTKKSDKTAQAAA